MKVIELYRIAYPLRPDRTIIKSAFLEARKLYSVNPAESAMIDANTYLYICKYYEDKLKILRDALGYERKLKNLAKKEKGEKV